MIWFIELFMGDDMEHNVKNSMSTKMMAIVVCGWKQLAAGLAAKQSGDHNLRMDYETGDVYNAFRARFIASSLSTGMRLENEDKLYSTTKMALDGFLGGQHCIFASDTTLQHIMQIYAGTIYPGYANWNRDVFHIWSRGGYVDAIAKKRLPVPRGTTHSNAGGRFLLARVNELHWLASEYINQHFANVGLNREARALIQLFDPPSEIFVHVPVEHTLGIASVVEQALDSACDTVVGQKCTLRTRTEIIGLYKGHGECIWASPTYDAKSMLSPTLIQALAMRKSG